MAKPDPLLVAGNTLSRLQLGESQRPKDTHPCVRVSAVWRVRVLLGLLDVLQTLPGRNAVKQAEKLRIEAQELEVDIWRRLAENDDRILPQLSDALIEYARLVNRIDRNRALQSLEEAAHADRRSMLKRNDGPSHRNTTITLLLQAVQLESCRSKNAARHTADEALRCCQWLRDNSPDDVGDLWAATAIIRSNLSNSAPAEAAVADATLGHLASLHSQRGREGMLENSGRPSSKEELVRFHGTAVAAYEGAVSVLRRKVETLSGPRRSQVQGWLACRLHELAGVHSSIAVINKLCLADKLVLDADFTSQWQQNLDHHRACATEASKEASDIFAVLYEENKSLYSAYYMNALCRHAAFLDAHQDRSPSVESTHGRLRYSLATAAETSESEEKSLAASLRAHSVALELWLSRDSDKHRFCVALTALAVATRHDLRRDSVTPWGRAHAEAARKYAFDARLHFATLSKSWRAKKTFKPTIDGGLRMCGHILDGI